MAKYTHFRFGVGIHESNGFWYSKYLMTYDDPSMLGKQWKIWKKLEKDLVGKCYDKREMLIDQWNAENGDLHDTIIIPSAYADSIQRQIFGKRYEKLKFDIWSVEPKTIAEMEKEVKIYEKN